MQGNPPPPERSNPPSKPGIPTRQHAPKSAKKTGTMTLEEFVNQNPNLTDLEKLDIALQIAEITRKTHESGNCNLNFSLGNFQAKRTGENGEKIDISVLPGFRSTMGKFDAVHKFSNTDPDTTPPELHNSTNTVLVSLGDPRSDIWRLGQAFKSLGLSQELCGWISQNKLSDRPNLETIENRLREKINPPKATSEVPPPPIEAVTPQTPNYVFIAPEIAEYTLAVMPDYVKNDPQEANANTLYLTEEGAYIVRDLKDPNKVHQGQLSRDIVESIYDLKNQINDVEFKKRVEQFTSKQGHTESPTETEIHETTAPKVEKKSPSIDAPNPIEGLRDFAASIKEVFTRPKSDSDSPPRTSTPEPITEDEDREIEIPFFTIPEDIPAPLSGMDSDPTQFGEHKTPNVEVKEENVQMEMEVDREEKKEKHRPKPVAPLFQEISHPISHLQIESPLMSPEMQRYRDEIFETMLNSLMVGHSRDLRYKLETCKSIRDMINDKQNEELNLTPQYDTLSNLRNQLESSPEYWRRALETASETPEDIQKLKSLITLDEVIKDYNALIADSPNTLSEKKLNKIQELFGTIQKSMDSNDIVGDDGLRREVNSKLHNLKSQISDIAVPRTNNKPESLGLGYQLLNSLRSAIVSFKNFVSSGIRNLANTITGEPKHKTQRV